MGAMASYLTSHALHPGDTAFFADLLGITPRAVRKLRARARRVGPARPAHRPRVERPTLGLLRCLVRKWHGLLGGHDGVLTLIAEAFRLGAKLTHGFAEWLVRSLKTKRAQRERLRVERERVHTQVLARDAVWSCDESFLGRDACGEVRALAVRETHVPRTLWLSLGPPAHAKDLVRALECTAAERGVWPFVICLDNGGANRSDELLRVLAEQQVIVLFNVPHTPQHNPFVERGFCDLKLATGLAGPAARMAETSQMPVWAHESGVLEMRDELHARLLAVSVALDRTPRWSLGAATPEEIDRSAPRAHHLVCRERFYRDACAALARVAGLQLPPRARRRAEREAIWSTLQTHGLVVRTRGGGQPSRPSKRNLLA